VRAVSEAIAGSPFVVVEGGHVLRIGRQQQAVAAVRAFLGG